MKREERKRRLNEAIVNMLYPPPPQPEQEELEPEEALIEGSGSDTISVGNLDECENAASTSGDEEHESETEKLTRAQRKRIRKKKLREEAMRRGKLIGPLLPTTATPCGDAPPARSNASEEGDELACANSKKMKQRRMAKRLAKEKRVASSSENCQQSSISSAGAVDLKEKEARM